MSKDLSTDSINIPGSGAMLLRTWQEGAGGSLILIINIRVAVINLDTRNKETLIKPSSQDILPWKTQNCYQDSALCDLIWYCSGHLLKKTFSQIVQQVLSSCHIFIALMCFTPVSVLADTFQLSQSITLLFDADNKWGNNPLWLGNAAAAIEKSSVDFHFSDKRGFELNLELAI